MSILTIITDTVQTGAIGYLIGAHIAQRKTFKALVKIHRNPKHWKSDDSDSGHVHILEQGDDN
ncbi:Uncharacterised protein [uncultured archaeon]|nr:Uncharacterised protein [uncultured archaeon]